MRVRADPCRMADAPGLLSTLLALCIMQRAQPALLYLVPWTVGIIVCLGWRRHELRKVCILCVCVCVCVCGCV
jgi:hypothetical protein